MKEEFKLNLSPIWLLISAIALTLPVFLPSSVHPQYFFQDIIGLVTTAMYILSFPAGFLAIPAMFLAELFLGVNPDTIGGMYVNVFLLCVLGYVQWFWIVPRILRNEPRFQMLNLFGEKSEMQLLQAKAANNIPFCDSDGQTPIERVFQEKDKK